MALVSVACVEDLIGTDNPSVATGNEVQFGLSLEDSETKTIYGPETDAHDAFPIYWSQGDKVLVASPQCVEGRDNAEYVVTPVTGQSYAEAMTKTGDFGVQWGADAAAFYSIYPSLGASWDTLEDDNVVAELNISDVQSANLVLGDGVYRSADMDNIIMYAQTSLVENGEPVVLKYKPYSTVIEFEMNLGQGTNGWGSVKVLSMTLTAPSNSNISGDFTLKFNNSTAPTILASGNNSNKILVDFTTQPVLNETNKQLKAKLALLPISGLSINGWTISVEVIEGTNTKATVYTKTLSNVGSLAPGKIHKIKLPAFTPATEWTYSNDKWITSLYDYKTIYLTELSIPGAWYALGKDENAYQASGHTANSLWDAGVRAFGVECRSYTPRKTINWGDNTNAPTRVAVSGVGSNQGGAYTHQTLQEGKMIYISKVIKDLSDAVAGTNEFAVLILSYADGGSGGHRTIDYQYFINGIKNEIEIAVQNGASNLFDGETLNKDTTVEDVLNKVIIKVNVDYNIPVVDYNSKGNILFSYNPHMKQLGADYYSTPQFSNLYWRAWDDEYKKNTSSVNPDLFQWCFSSANRTSTNTSDIPTYAQRKKALLSMVSHSREITSVEGHNVWFYFNAGGTDAPNAEDDTDAADARNFAASMNPWLYEIIRLKANGGTDTYGYYTGVQGTRVESDPSPLGIVMFNQCTGADATYYGQRIIKEIVEMNNKFKLLHKRVEVRSAAQSYSSGMNTSDAAFGWD